MTFNKKVISNIIYGLLIALLLIPQTRVYFLRLISFSPRTESEANRVQLTSYDWRLKGVNTTDLDFNIAKGEVAFVHIWSTRCPHCVAEMPSIQKLYDDYKDKVLFVLETSDADDKIQEFMTKHGYDLPIFHNLSNPPAEFSTRTIPKSFLIDKSGKIVVESGRADWDTKKTRQLLDKLLVD